MDSSIFADVKALSYTALNGLSTDIQGGVTSTISGDLNTIDTAITNIINRTTMIGAASNRLDALSEGLDVQRTNMTSALSTVKDADIAEESATYVQQQILQSASASLLKQANSAPQIALTLIQG